MLPPEAIAELKRIKREHKAREAVVDAMIAYLVYELLYPAPEPAEEVSLDLYLAGR